MGSNRVNMVETWGHLAAASGGSSQVEAEVLGLALFGQANNAKQYISTLDLEEWVKAEWPEEEKDMDTDHTLRTFFEQVLKTFAKKYDRYLNQGYLDESTVTMGMRTMASLRSVIATL